MNFGSRLKELRELKGIKQKDLAMVLGVGSRMVSFYEQNKHIPRDANSIILLAQYFDVSMDYLFGLTDVKNYKSVSNLEYKFNTLSDKGQEELISYLEYLKVKYPKSNTMQD